MDGNQDQITHVSDTALMVAACRARETARPDGFIRDPFAERLAGERGMAIAQALPRIEVMCFGVGVRSRFVDELVLRCISEHGVKCVLSVGSGLDARPWRLDLPPELLWVEIDFQDMIDYKSGVMASESPRCRLQHVAADLTDPAQRRTAFAAAEPTPALMITEGLLMYLPGGTVEAIAADAAAHGRIGYWLSDITSPVFARNAGMGTFKQVQEVRAEGHLDGLQILDVIRGHGWDFLHRRSYVTDVWPFAAARLQAAAAKRAEMNAPPREPVPPDDPTGVHVFGRS
jgi:methyltransferase (TIGR00027 family)